MGKILLLFFVITLISPGLLKPLWPFDMNYGDDDTSNEKEIETDPDNLDYSFPGFLSRKIEEDLSPWSSMNFRPVNYNMGGTYNTRYNPTRYSQNYEPVNFKPNFNPKPVNSYSMENIPIFSLRFGSTFSLDSAPELTSEEIETINLIARFAQILEKLDDLELEEIIQVPCDLRDDSDTTVTGVSASNPNVDVQIVYPNFEETSEEKTTVEPIITSTEKISSEEILNIPDVDDANEVFNGLDDSRPLDEQLYVTPSSNLNNDNDFFKELGLDDSRPLDEQLYVTASSNINNDIENNVSSLSEKSTEKNSNEIIDIVDTNGNEVVVEVEAAKPEQKVNNRETEWDEDSNEYNSLDLQENNIKLLEELNSEQPIYKIVQTK